VNILNFEVLSIVYLIGLLVLILPKFIDENSKFKTLLRNFSYWVVIVLILVSVIYFFNLLS
jgi:heme/copper-type cytochrome/quinol oxidase subunit 1